jgi:hypothetical protein
MGILRDYLIQQLSKGNLRFFADSVVNSCRVTRLYAQVEDHSFEDMLDDAAH